MKTIVQLTLVALSHQMHISETLEELIDSGKVNIFNFDEPMNGDINGFVLQTGDCDCDDGCSDPEPEPEYECPEVSYPAPIDIDAVDFTDADDELCRSRVNFIIDAYKQSFPRYVENETNVCNAMISILELVEERGVSLSNNEEFI